MPDQPLVNQQLSIDTFCTPRVPNGLLVAVALVATAFCNELNVRRTAAADFLVTNSNDSGTGSLREAILNANNLPGSHQIDLTAVRGTITLATPLPPMYQSMSIRGPGASDLTISGNDQHRVFFALQGDITIKDLSITDGHARGGAGGGSAGGGLGAGGAVFVNSGVGQLSSI